MQRRIQFSCDPEKGVEERADLMFLDLLLQLDGCCNLSICVQASYYVDEVKDKSGIHIDVTSWKQEFVEDLPEQKNGCVDTSV